MSVELLIVAINAFGLNRDVQRQRLLGGVLNSSADIIEEAPESAGAHVLHSEQSHGMHVVNFESRRGVCAFRFCRRLRRWRLLRKASSHDEECGDESH